MLLDVEAQAETELQKYQKERPIRRQLVPKKGCLVNAAAKPHTGHKLSPKKEERTINVKMTLSHRTCHNKFRMPARQPLCPKFLESRQSGIFPAPLRAASTDHHRTISRRRGNQRRPTTIHHDVGSGTDSAKVGLFSIHRLKSVPSTVPSPLKSPLAQFPG